MSFHAALALFCIGIVIYHLSSGEIVGKGGWVTPRDKNPGRYWVTIAIEILLAVGMVGLVIHDLLAKGS
jgi:hypothetical protein